MRIVIHVWMVRVLALFVFGSIEWNVNALIMLTSFVMYAVQYMVLMA